MQQHRLLRHARGEGRAGSEVELLIVVRDKGNAESVRGLFLRAG